MPLQDGLTDKFRQQLSSAGIFADDQEITSFLERQNLTPGLPSPGTAPPPGEAPSLEEQRRRLIEAGLLDPSQAAATDRGIGGNMLSGLGEFVWGALDTGTLGLMGYADRKLFDDTLAGTLLGPAPETEDTLWNTWGAALGGLAGFIGAGPFGAVKFGAKAAKMAAAPVIRGAAKAGKLGVPKGTKVLKSVTDDMIKAGTKGNALSTKEAGWVTSRIEHLVARAKTDKDIATNWSSHVKKNLDDILENGFATGKLTAAQKDAVKKMFHKDLVGTRPMNDFVDIFVNKIGGRTGFAVGSMIQEATMFGTIDAVMEGFGAAKDDRPYDFMAPVWGMGVGAGFGALKFMKPAGRGARFSKDFQQGIRGALLTSPFNKVKNLTRLQKHATVLGNFFQQNKIDDVVEVLYRGANPKLQGKMVSFKLADAAKMLERDGAGRQMGIYGKTGAEPLGGFLSKDAAKKMIQDGLDQTTKKYGRELIKWSGKAEWMSIAENWHRMVIGAGIMNGRSIASIAMGESEFELGEMLPHILIGAAVNRRGMPRQWDLNPRSSTGVRNVNQLRMNLHALGVESKQIDSLPSLARQTPWLSNPLRNQPELIDRAKELGIFVDSEEATFDNLPKGENSIDNSIGEGKQQFDILYGYLNSVQGERIEGFFIKPKSMISESQANKMLKAWGKLNPDVKDAAGMERHFEEHAVDNSEALENEFINAIESLSKIPELKFVVDKNNLSSSHLPTLVASLEFADAVAKGEVSIKDPVTGKEVTGKEGAQILSDAIKKVENLFKIMREGTGIARFPKDRKRPQDILEVGDLQSEVPAAEWNKIIDVVTQLEGKVNYPDLLRDAPYDLAVHMFNNGIYRASKAASKLFDKKNTEVHSPLRKILLANNVVSTDGNLVGNIDAFKFEGGTEAEVKLAKQLLGDVISMVGIQGDYQIVDVAEGDITVKTMDIMGTLPTSLRGFLNQKGLNTSPDILNLIKHGAIDYLTRERVRDTSLSHMDIAQFHSIMTMVIDKGSGFAGFEPSMEGKRPGFWIRKAEFAGNMDQESKGYKSRQTALDHYNSKVDSLIEKGEGLIVLKDTIELANPDVANALWDATIVADDANSARVEIQKLMAGLDPKYGAVSLQIQDMINKGGTNVGRVAGILQSAGVIKASYEDGRLTYTKFYKKFNDQAAEQISTDIEFSKGMTKEQSITIAEEQLRRAADLADNADTVIKHRTKTLQEFFRDNKFRNLNDHVDVDIKDAGEWLDGRIYRATETGERTKDAIYGDTVNRIIDEIIVKRDGKDIAVGDLSARSKARARREYRDDVMSIVTTRVQQLEGTSLAWRDGVVNPESFNYLDNPYAQFFRRIGLTIIPVTGSSSTYQNKERGRSSHVFFSIFDYQPTGKITRLTPAIQTIINNEMLEFRAELDRMDTIQLPGRPEPTPTGGLIIIEMSGSTQPFAILKSEFKVVRNQFNSFMDRLRPSIDDGTISAEPLARLRNIQNALNGYRPEGPRVGDRVVQRELGPGATEMEIVGVENGKIRIAESSVDETGARVQGGTVRGLKDVGDFRPLEEFAAGAEYYEGAVRRLLVEQLTRSNGDASNLIEAINGQDIQGILKRFPMVETKNFKREIPQIMDELPMTRQERSLYDSFKDRDVNVVQWNDADHAKVASAIAGDIAKLEIDGALLNERGQVSGYDSISYVSRDYMTYLALTNGFKNPSQHSLVKPVISSAYGQDTLLLGKTLFVASPDLQRSFFSKNPNVDILVTTTASKVTDSRITPLEVTAEQLKTHIVPTESIFTLKKETIGVKPDAIDSESAAKLSQSLWNYANNVESGNIFENEYQGRLSEALTKVGETVQDRGSRNAFIREGAFESHETLETLSGGGASAQTVGGMIYFSMLHPQADPMSYSSNIFQNKLYKTFIDKVVNRQSYEGTHAFGGKSVLIQSPHHTLRPTLADSDGIKQVGQMMLPNHVREASLAELINKGHEVRLISVNDGYKTKLASDVFGEEVWNNMVSIGGNIGGLHDLLGTLNSMSGEKAHPNYVVAHNQGKTKWVFLEGDPQLQKAKQGRNLVNERSGKHATVYEHKRIKDGNNRPMEVWVVSDKNQLDIALDAAKEIDADIATAIQGGPNTYELAIMTNRYPRTRPNDLLVLGLKGFLEKGYGNSMIVNSMDVLNVLEGDYDVDTNDFYFTAKKNMWDYAQRTQKPFIQHIDPEKIAIPNPVNFHQGITEESTMFHDHFVDSNKLTKRKVVGMSQNFPRLLSHLEHIGTKDTVEGSPTEGMIVLSNHRRRTLNGDIETVRIAMDYDSNNVQHEIALQQQFMVDYGYGRHPELALRPSDWSDSVLFPSKEAGAPSKEYSSIGFINNVVASATELAQPRRPRVFVKHVQDPKTLEWEPVDLNWAEKQFIKIHMNQHSRMLKTSTEIFDQSGEGKKPGYKDVLDYAGRYFSFYNSKYVDNRINTQLWRMAGGDETKQRQIEGIFGRAQRTLKANRRWKYENDEVTLKKDKKGKPIAEARKDDFMFVVKQGPRSHDIEFNETLTKNIDNLHEGFGGSVYDRILNQVWRDDPLKIDIGGTRGLTGTHMETIDFAIADYMGSDRSKGDLDAFTMDMARMVTQVNKGAAQLKYLKAEWGRTSRNKYLKEADKKIKLDALNESITKVEARVKDFLPTEYWNKRRGEDVPYAPLEYVSVTGDELIKSTVQLYTIRGALKLDPARFGGEAMNKDIQDIRKILATYYSDDNAMKTTLRFGETTLLDETQIEYLANTKPSQTVEEVVYNLMDKGVQDYGFAFLLKFADPGMRRDQIGVFNGRPVPVAYVGQDGTAPKRYARILKYLTRKAYMDGSPSAKAALEILTSTEASYDNLLRKKVSYMPDMTNPIWGGEYNLRIPDFPRSMQSAFTRFNSISFGRETGGRRDKFGLWDNDLIEFYRDIFILQGAEPEFDKYMEKITNSRALKLGSQPSDPMKYFAEILEIQRVEGNIHEFVSKALSSGITASGNKVVLERFKKNPIFVLLGGMENGNGRKFSLNPINRLSSDELSKMSELVKAGRDISMFEGGETILPSKADELLNDSEVSVEIC